MCCVFASELKYVSYISSKVSKFVPYTKFVDVDIFNIPEACPEVKEYTKLFNKYRYKKRNEAESRKRHASLLCSNWISQ